MSSTGMTWIWSVGGGGMMLLGLATLLGLCTAAARLCGLMREISAFRQTIGFLARIIGVNTLFQIIAMKMTDDIYSMRQAEFWGLFIGNLMLSVIVNIIQQRIVHRTPPPRWFRKMLLGGMLATALLYFATYLADDVVFYPICILVWGTGILGGHAIIRRITGNPSQIESWTLPEDRSSVGWGRELAAGGLTGIVAGASVLEGLLLLCFIGGCLGDFHDIPMGILYIVLLGHLVGGVIVVGLGALSSLLYALVLLIEVIMRGVEHVAFLLASQIIIPIRFPTQVCGYCLRYSFPFRSHYVSGRRCCEHCGNEIPRFKSPGTVIVTFGNITLTSDERILWLANPDYEQKRTAIDVAAVYIDPETCNRRLFERFTTFILNHPPRFGLQSVRIFSTGSLKQLDPNMRNVLLNNFPSIQRVKERIC